MEKINVFIGILLFLLLIMLWFCFVIGNKADKYKAQLKQLQSQYKRKIREYNTMVLWVEAHKEALEQTDNQISSAKH